MKNYYKFDFNINPYSADAADLLAAFLADEGFDSFEEKPDGLTAYIPADDYREGSIEEATAGFPIETEIKWERELIEGRDWNEEWEKRYFKPLVLAGGRLVVHSTFHTDFPEAEYEVIVDPKMAFGTGHHATTTMMANHLFNMDLKGKKILDMGTGTGILAIIANKLGAGDVTGIEIDEGAYENALENAELNEADVKLIHGDAGKLKDIEDVDVFLANINRNIILADLKDYSATIKSGGEIVLSGFYEKDIPLLAAALERNGFTINERATEGEDWASVRATKIK